MDRLVTAEAFFEGMSPRWVTAQCRAGRVPGARKVGKVWFLDVAAFEAANDTGPAVEDSIEADVRARFRCTAGGGR